MILELGLAFQGMNDEELDAVRQLLYTLGASKGSFVCKGADIVIRVRGDATLFENAVHAWGGQVVWDQQYPDRE